MHFTGIPGKIKIYRDSRYFKPFRAKRPIQQLEFRLMTAKMFMKKFYEAYEESVP